MNFGHVVSALLDAFCLPGQHSLDFRLEGALSCALVLYGCLEVIDFALEVVILLEGKSLDGFDEVQPFICLLLGLVFVKGADKDPVLLGLVEELAEHEELVIQFCLVLVI